MIIVTFNERAMVLKESKWWLFTIKADENPTVKLFFFPVLKILVKVTLALFFSAWSVLCVQFSIKRLNFYWVKFSTVYIDFL